MGVLNHPTTKKFSLGLALMIWVAIAAGVVAVNLIKGRELERLREQLEQREKEHHELHDQVQQVQTTIDTRLK